MARFGGSGATVYSKPAPKKEEPVVEKVEKVEEVKVVESPSVEVKTEEIVVEKPKKVRRTPARKKASIKKQEESNNE